MVLHWQKGVKKITALNNFHIYIYQYNVNKNLLDVIYEIMHRFDQCFHTMKFNL